MSSLQSHFASVTFSTPNDPQEHPEHDAAFQDEYNAWCDAKEREIAEAELDELYARHKANEAYWAMPSVDSTPAEVEAWWGGAA